MNHPETQVTPGTQNTGQRQTIQRHWQHRVHKTQDKDKQSRDTGNIGHTKHRTKTNNPETLATSGTQNTGPGQTIQRHWQHRVHKTQDKDKQSRDTGNIGYTKHRTKTSNPETLATSGTQNTGQGQTIQRHWQHRVHKTQDKDKQSKKTQHRKLKR